MIRHLRRISIFLFLLLIAMVVQAAEIKFQVSYVSGDKVFITIGKTSGLKVGERLEIGDPKRTTAVLLVEFISSSSASCSLESGKVQVGDTGVYTQKIKEASVVNRDSVTVKENPVQPKKRKVIAPQTGSASVPNEVNARLSIQHLTQVDHSNSDFSYNEPSLVLRGKVDHLFGSNHSLHVKLRGRKTYRNYDAASQGEEWSSRVYEIMIVNEDRENGFSYRFGRVRSSMVRGMGSLDGAHLHHRLSGDVNVGIFGGFEPNLETSQPDGSASRAGIFFSYTRGEWKRSRMSTTLSLLGSYQNGEINNESLYQQFNYAWKRWISFYESAEVSFNRGWKKDYDSSVGKLSNLLVEVQVSPLPIVDLTLGYDNRVAIRTWQTRATPDTLFDDAERKGLRYGATIKPSKRLRVRLGGSYRTINGVDKSTSTQHGTVSYSDLLKTGINGSLRYAQFSNAWIDGSQPSIRLARTLSRSVYLSVESGIREYDLGGDTYSNNWYLARMNWNLNRSILFSGMAEWTNGDTEHTSRYMIEAGYRF